MFTQDCLFPQKSVNSKLGHKTGGRIKVKWTFVHGMCLCVRLWLPSLNLLC